MRQTKKLLIAAIALGTTSLVDAGPALAHAMSIGYENAGPGSVTVWLGTYNHGGHHLEGSLQLEGVNGTLYGPTINPFGSLTADGAKPAGLIDGLTNFFVSTPLGVPGPLVGSDDIWLSTLCSACGPANHWEGVTFTGLSAGDYQFTYVPVAFPSQEWDPYNPSLNGIFTLTGEVVNPGNDVPEPATLAVLGAGLLGLGIARRRKSA